MNSSSTPNSEQKFLSSLHSASKRKRLDSTTVQKRQWEQVLTQLSIIPSYPNLTYALPGDDVIAKISAQAVISSDPLLSCAVMFTSAIITKEYQTHDELVDIVGSFIMVLDLSAFQDWYRVDSEPNACPIIIRVHDDKTEALDDNEGYIYYATLHIELEPDRYKKVCDMWDLVANNA